MEIKWSEDGEFATVSKEDFEALKGNFDKGYGKGKAAAQRDFENSLKSLDLDPEKFTDQVKDLRDTVKKLESGQIPPEKLNETDLVKSLNGKLQTMQEQLEQKSQAFNNLQGEFDGFKKKSLIDSNLTALARAKGALEGKEQQVGELFKMEYKPEVVDGEKVVVKNAAGNVVFDEKGNELGLDGAFERFFSGNPHLFKAGGQNGGSGGGADGPPANVSLKDLKTDADKSAFIQKHGRQAYQQLVIQASEG